MKSNDERKAHKRIQEYVTEHQSASLDEPVAVFDVSKNTIRRDVQELVERGELKKVYGGVSVILLSILFHLRTRMNLIKITLRKMAYILPSPIS
ncbi:DeoR/GlpR family transcriptional regulator of sugar metabolism [Neobacillus niacini]|nr:DeoR/GlpR family transcriptional regulator of sugar metabolism [Neobacillus niacini]